MGILFPIILLIYVVVQLVIAIRKDISGGIYQKPDEVEIFKQSLWDDLT